MAAIMALGIAVLALALSAAVAWMVLAWRQERKAAEALALRLQAEGRIEELTAQTLAAMRDAARRIRG